MSGCVPCWSRVAGSLWEGELDWITTQNHRLTQAFTGHYLDQARAIPRISTLELIKSGIVKLTRNLGMYVLLMPDEQVCTSDVR